MRFEIHGQSLTCHSPKATKRNADARRKAQLRETVLDLAREAGMSDGRTYAVCVMCGCAATVGASEGEGTALHMGHVVSDKSGGVWCPCNIVPMCGECNWALGDLTATDMVEFHYDTRDYWAGVWSPKPRTRNDYRRADRGPVAWTTIHPTATRLRCNAEDALQDA